MKSVFSKKEERLSDALLTYAKFTKTFPESEKLSEVEGMAVKLHEELTKTREQLTTISQNN